MTDTVDPAALGALSKLGRRRGKKVPFVQQLEAADCGAACLAMVLAYHGRTMSLDEVRQAAGTSSRGTDAMWIVRAGEQLGMRGRGVSLDLPQLRYLPTGSVLHWGMNHFVVLERVRRGGVDICDPGYGRRHVPLDKFSKQFTGVALIFEPGDEFQLSDPGKSTIWRYLGQLLRQPGLISRVLVTSIVLRVLALALPVLTAMVVDRVVPHGDHGLLVVVGAGVGAVLLFQFLASLIRAHLLIQLRTNLDTRMTIGFVSHLLSLPYAYFNRRSAGDLLLRVSSNTSIRDMLTSNLLSTLLDGSLAIVYLVLLFVLSPTMALVTLGAGALQVGVLLLARHRYAALTSQDLESQARAHSYLVQMLVGIETLKVAGAENRALEHWSHLFVDELNISLSRGRLQALVDASATLLQAAAPLVLLGVGASLVLDHQIGLGTMLATSALAAGFLTPLSSLMSSALQLQMLGSYVERIEDVLHTEPEQRRAGTVVPPKLSGEIELQHVSFRYSPSTPLVVRDVSLKIAPGTSVAIVGRSGSGKSTLAALLLGLHRPVEGRIVYDGYDLVELDHRRLRQQLGMVPQSPFIFSGSIRNNIALADPSAPFDRILQAARRACVDADIRAMPMGYESIVADGGATLSGGQRQRIALARALLHDPSVLVLDEATSSLDATTERDVMDHLVGLRCTRIIIAHRLSTITNADQIIVMEDGRLVETGTHAELLRKKGAYAALVQDQAFAGKVAS
jgi:ABC-type bacteriocin/lantibiotic exporter with double-glycine peptidase domain